jgi:metallo-beta-lactamase family protein
VSEGFRGKVYCTRASSEIAKIALLDSAHLQVEDAEFKQKRHKKEGRRGKYPVVPLYTEADAHDTFPLIKPWNYEKPLRLAKGIEATFHDAGHILGSAMIRLRLTADGDSRTILFSGDIGRWDKPILRDPSVFADADYVIMESTYGNRTHEDRKDVDTLLAETILDTRKRGGNILIPSFAIGRTQEVLYRLNTLLMENKIPHMRVFIDSPMAIRVTKVFKQHRELFDEEMAEFVDEGHSPFNLPGLEMVSSVADSKAINEIRSSVIIIAGSGMCTGGRIKHHLVHNISDPKSTILFVGFQAVGTLGREIVKGAEEVRVLGQKYPVKAKVVEIHGFSAHADRDELLNWVSHLTRVPRHVFVTHGEPDAAKSFADLLSKQKQWDVSTPAYKDQVTLE